MRFAISHLSYHVNSRDYDLPQLFPSCKEAVDCWIRHCLTSHEFVKCKNLEFCEDTNMVVITSTDKYVSVEYSYTLEISLKYLEIMFIFQGIRFPFATSCSLFCDCRFEDHK